MNISNLADGVYSITGNMVKVDKTTASMSDAAIDHTIKLTVKNGKYYITLNFNGLTVGQKLGYLSQLKYLTQVIHLISMEIRMEHLLMLQLHSCW